MCSKTLLSLRALIIEICVFSLFLMVIVGAENPSMDDSFMSLSCPDEPINLGETFVLEIFTEKDDLTNDEVHIWLSVPDGEQRKDLPPIIVRRSSYIQDDPDGPYVIGKYEFNGGFGTTIRQMVPRSDKSVGTDFYAQFKKGNQVFVKFNTPLGTSPGIYKIFVETQTEDPEDQSNRIYITKQCEVKIQ